MDSLVDRTEELAVLNAVLAQARAGASPTIVTIEGGCGLGKTALLDAFLARLEPGTSATRVRAERLDRLSAGALEAGLRDGSEVVVMDDAQWCNRPSFEAFESALSQRRVKLVILAFDDGPPPLREAPAHRIVLSALDDRQIEQIVRERAPALSEQRVRAIVENAHGVPYEAVVLAVLSGDDTSAGRAIARFVAALPPFARSVAQMLALIAAPVEPRLARALWGEGREMDAALDALAVLIRRDGERIELNHPLTAAAVVETVPMKIPLHRRIIGAMERTGVQTLDERILFVEQFLGAGVRERAQRAALDLALDAASERAPYAQLWASSRHLELGEPPDDRFVEFYAQFFGGLMSAQQYERAEAIVAHALSEAQRRKLGGIVTLATQLIQAQWAVDRQDAAHASYERYLAAFTNPDDRAQLRAAAPWLRAS